MENEIIIVKQLPEIVEHLNTIKGEIELRVAEALSLECTEETVKEIKAVRAALSKDFQELETKRKEVKSKILSPYEQFEQVYKDCVTNIFKPADGQLAAKISEVENGLKEQKKSEVVEYFDELKLAKGIDFVQFETIIPKVNLSDSIKSLKDRVNDFLSKTADDLAMIDTQEYAAEILVEYKKSLNVSQAIMVVTRRIKDIDDEQKRVEESRAEREQQAAAEKHIDDVVDEQKALAPPEETYSCENATVIIPKYTAVFKVTDTIEKLKALKEFMIMEGIVYEQIKS